MISRILSHRYILVKRIPQKLGGWPEGQIELIRLKSQAAFAAEVASYQVVVLESFSGFNVCVVTSIYGLSASLAERAQSNFYCRNPSTNLAFTHWLGTGALVKLTLIPRVVFLDTFIDAHRAKDSPPVLEPGNRRAGFTPHRKILA